jgi:hypothetical protein
MMAPFDPWAIEHSAVRRVLLQNLALEDTPIFQRQVKYVSVRGIGHRIKPYDGGRILKALQGVAHAPQIAMTTMQTPHTSKRLSLRH